MSKARRHTLGLIFATATVALSYLVGSSVAPAHAATVDPVEDPTYWSQIWDRVGAMDPSGFNPTADWTTLEDTWAADGYLADAASAAAAKAAIDASAAEVTAMEAAGSLPAELAIDAGIGAAGIAVAPLAVGAGVTLLVGTGTGRRIIRSVWDGLFSGGGSGSNSSFATTGRVIWSWQTGMPSAFSSWTPVPTTQNAWLANYEYKNQTTGALGSSSSTGYCDAGATCSTAYDQSKSQLLATAGSHVLTSGTGTSTVVGSYRLPGEVHRTIKGIEAYGSQVPDWTTTSGGAQTDPGSSSAKASNVRQAIESNPTLHQQYDCKLDPSYTCPTITPPSPTVPSIITAPLPWTPIYLPQPFPGETLESYAERLRSKQWVGAITAVDDSMGYPSGSPALQLAPGTVTRLTVGTTTVNLYSPTTGQPVAWPLTPPLISTSTTPVTVTAVPATYSPAGGGGIHMPTISFACQFPFGFICWAQDVTGWFNVSPQAPDFDFTIPDQTVGGNTYHVGSHYDVNLNVMDSYMSTFRSILSVVLWVGGIYWLAVKLLGFHPGGDPGEAIDEGLDFDGL